MHVKKLFFIFLLFMPLFLRAKLQGQMRVDSLLSELPKEKEDTIKVKLLNDISFCFNSINADEGIKYGIKGLDLATHLEWQRGMAAADNALFANYYAKSDMDAALKCILLSLSINKGLNDKLSVARNMVNIANIYESQSDFTKALDYQFTALKMLEEIGQKETVAICLMNIGNIYIELGNYPKEQEYLFSALKKYEELNNRRGVAQCLINLGTGYYFQKDYSRALEYHNKALVLFEELGIKFSIEKVTGNMGEIYLAVNNYSRALEFDFKALKMSEELGDKNAISNTLFNVGNTYLQIAKDTSGTVAKNSLIPTGKIAVLNKSIDYLNRSIMVAKEINALNLLMDANQEIADAYKLSGRYREALESYKVYTQIKDSVFSNDNKVKIANLETKREKVLKEKQIELNKLSESKKRNEQASFMVGIALLSIVIIVVMKNYNAQKKANKVKEGLLIQKDLLMKEIHHRVKNNLQVISTLLDLGMSNIADEHAKDVMTESTTRVKSISLIHQQLYQNENITGIEFSKFTKDLLQQVTSVFQNSRQHIVLENNIPETMLDIDTAVPLGLILNELMTNSYKYAFSNKQEGSIEISLQQRDDHYLLTYKDSGPGLSMNFNISSLKSLGMQVMHDLSIQIGGAFTYVAADKAFIITFKDEAGRRLTD